jgi:flagellar basal body L-ring protein FlgH
MMFLKLSIIFIFITGCSLVHDRPYRKKLYPLQDALGKEDKFEAFRRKPAYSPGPNDWNTKRKDLESEYEKNSLWVGIGRDPHLYSNQIDKQVGDIILVHIMDKLKKEIFIELKLFESYGIPKRTRNGAIKESANKNKEDKNISKAHISTIVEEEINRNHILIKGRKSVFYKGTKKLIEFRGLVSRRDISENDTIESDKILETTIKVLR